MKKNISCMIWLLPALLMLFLAAVATADDPAVSGVFGLAPLDEPAALAVWVPLETEESISGVRWYNNDGDVAFPALLAVAGAADQPSAMDDAVTVATQVSGETLGWSEVTFEPALASATPGLYLIFRLPAGGEFTAEGEGAGVGFQVGDGEMRSWVSTEAGKWNPLSADYQMAVAPIMNEDKSGGVLVLGEETAPAGDDESGDNPPAPVVAGLSAAPNPFNPLTEITFALPQGGDVKLRIFDVRGRSVRTLVSGSLAAGVHTVTWNGRNDAGRAEASGVYLALLEAGPIRLTKRLTLVQ
jgi:hypothetical protein